MERVHREQLARLLLHTRAQVEAFPGWELVGELGGRWRARAPVRDRSAQPGGRLVVEARTPGELVRLVRELEGAPRRREWSSSRCSGARGEPRRRRVGRGLRALGVARSQLAAAAQEERRALALVQVVAAESGPSAPHVRATVDAWRGAQLAPLGRAPVRAPRG